MAEPAPARPRHGNSYNIFILVLTVLSLLVMVVMLLPLDSATRELLNRSQLAALRQLLEKTPRKQIRSSSVTSFDLICTAVPWTHSVRPHISF